jgi:hypothetical protein
MKSIRPLLAVVLAAFVCSAGQLAHAQVGKPVTITDANTISEAALAGLPHMTPALAKAVIAKRPFKTMKEFDTALAALTKEQRTELYAKCSCRSTSTPRPMKKFR